MFNKYIKSSKFLIKKIDPENDGPKLKPSPALLSKLQKFGQKKLSSTLHKRINTEVIREENEDESPVKKERPQKNERASSSGLNFSLF